MRRELTDMERVVNLASILGGEDARRVLESRVHTLVELGKECEQALKKPKLVDPISFAYQEETKPKQPVR